MSRLALALSTVKRAAPSTALAGCPEAGISAAVNMDLVHRRIISCHPGTNCPNVTGLAVSGIYPANSRQTRRAVPGRPEN